MATPNDLRDHLVACRSSTSPSGGPSPSTAPVNTFARPLCLASLTYGLSDFDKYHFLLAPRTVKTIGELEDNLKARIEVLKSQAAHWATEYIELGILWRNFPRVVRIPLTRHPHVKHCWKTFNILSTHPIAPHELVSIRDLARNTKSAQRSLDFVRQCGMAGDHRFAGDWLRSAELAVEEGEAGHSMLELEMGDLQESVQCLNSMTEESELGWEEGAQERIKWWQDWVEIFLADEEYGAEQSEDRVGDVEMDEDEDPFEGWPDLLQ